MMKIRRFNNHGIKRLGEFLDSFSTDSPQEYPTKILTDKETSEDIEKNIEIEAIAFKNRYEAAKYFFELFRDSGIKNIDRDRGLWAWLSLFYFDQLCPMDNNRQRKTGEQARWIPVIDNYRKYYRHLLAGPYRIYRAHRDAPERATILLCGPLHKPGEIVEQLAARLELITNPAVVETATMLYFDRASRQPRKGAAAKINGGARRFAEVLDQFDVTWDLYSMQSSDLIRMLPREFDKFRR